MNDKTNVKAVLQSPVKVFLHELGNKLMELGENNQQYAAFITTLYWGVGQMILPTHKLKGSDVASMAAMGSLPNFSVEIQIVADVLEFRIYQTDQTVPDSPDWYVGKIVAKTYEANGVANIWRNGPSDLQITTA